jgi:hypothetical protein
MVGGWIRIVPVGNCSAGHGNVPSFHIRQAVL